MIGNRGSISYDKKQDLHHPPVVRADPNERCRIRRPRQKITTVLFLHQIPALCQVVCDFQRLEGVNFCPFFFPSYQRVCMRDRGISGDRRGREGGDLIVSLSYFTLQIHLSVFPHQSVSVSCFLLIPEGHSQATVTFGDEERAKAIHIFSRCYVFFAVFCFV